MQTTFSISRALAFGQWYLTANARRMTAVAVAVVVLVCLSGILGEALEPGGAIYSLPITVGIFVLCSPLLASFSLRRDSLKRQELNSPATPLERFLVRLVVAMVLTGIIAVVSLLLTDLVTHFQRLLLRGTDLWILTSLWQILTDFITVHGLPVMLCLMVWFCHAGILVFALWARHSRAWTLAWLALNAVALGLIVSFTGVDILHNDFSSPLSFLVCIVLVACIATFYVLSYRLYRI